MQTYLKALLEMARDELRRASGQDYVMVYRECENILAMIQEYDRLTEMLWGLQNKTERRQPIYVNQFRKSAIVYKFDGAPCIYCGNSLQAENDYFKCAGCGAIMEIHDKPHNKLYDGKHTVYYFTPGNAVHPFWAIVRGEE